MPRSGRRSAALLGPGLVGLHIGRRDEDGEKLAVLVSVWRD
jgi:hypothetical protein